MISASELMDRVYSRQRHVYDATRKFYLLGRDGLIGNLNPPTEGRVLEIACGTARNLIAVARLYPTARCYGIDVSAAMLETARRSVGRAGLEHRIELAEADAERFDPDGLFGVPSFDRVIISYALSMIPGWRAALHRAAECIAPGGSLHIVDFGDQARMPPGFKSLLETWLSKFHVTPRVTLGQEIEALSVARGLRARRKPQFRGYVLSAELVRS